MSKKRTRLENKEIHAKRLADERKLALLEALAEKNDPVSRKAGEIFRRPAFEGTELAPHRQQDVEQSK